MKDSISIVNLTRYEIKDNRKKINELTEGPRNIVSSVANETKRLGRRVSHLEILTHKYWLYKMLVDRLRDYFLDVHLSLNHLELQLNLLSLGHLSPSIIALPDKFKFTSEPDNDIWHYYRILSCSTLFDKRSIVIVVKVPLLDRDNSYILYRILNFLLPLPTLPGIRRESKLTAKFKLEVEMIVVSGAGTES